MLPSGGLGAPHSLLWWSVPRLIMKPIGWARSQPHWALSLWAVVLREVVPQQWLSPAPVLEAWAILQRDGTRACSSVAGLGRGETG